jgi:hypothetical protein
MTQKKYSAIKEKLQIEVDKKTDNGLAQLTHYFQNQMEFHSILKTMQQNI